MPDTDYYGDFALGGTGVELDESMKDENQVNDFDLSKPELGEDNFAA